MLKSGDRSVNNVVMTFGVMVSSRVENNIRWHAQCGESCMLSVEWGKSQKKNNLKHFLVIRS